MKISGYVNYAQIGRPGADRRQVLGDHVFRLGLCKATWWQNARPSSVRLLLAHGDRVVAESVEVTENCYGLFFEAEVRKTVWMPDNDSRHSQREALRDQPRLPHHRLRADPDARW